MNSLVRKISIVSGLGLFIVSLFSLSFFSTDTLHAQTLGTTSVNGIDIAIDPSNPAPGANVTVSVESYSTDLNTASITWFVDGKSLAKGTGLKSISVTAPVNGKSIQVVAAIDTAEGANIKKVVTVQPGDVDLIWETSGYVPPLFRGKVTTAYQNKVKITAIPHFFSANGKQIDPSKLLYKWKNGDTVLGDQSGYGKQSVIIAGSIIPRELDIDVLVTAPDQKNIAGETQVAINADKPEIIFYPDDPLYGVMYSTAIASALRFFHNEIKVVAVPYGFDINDASLSYNWNINNVSQDNLTSSKSIVLRVADGQQGSSNIELSMVNSGNKILQGATAAFTALFDTTKNTATSPTF
ncbi:MAG: hypothetical protein WCQ60_02300 [bacterium]